MIRILINFSTLKSGGGQNVALNFLYAVDSCRLEGVEFYYLAAKDSEVHRCLKQDKTKHYIVAPRNPLLRILFEVFVGWYFLTKFKIDIVYSYFGYAWFPRHWPQVTGSVDSNLYFPEIDFWSEYIGLRRWKRKIIDFYRICGVKRSKAVVFENEALEERGQRLFKLKHTKTIKPSICFNDNKLDFKLPVNLEQGMKSGLFLCGWHFHKNIMLIPELASEMRKRNRSFMFFLTAPQDWSSQHREFCNLVSKYNAGDMVFITGPVLKDELESLYNQIDFVFLLSRLESFSNNIIEAWHFGKPLLVSDALWAHSICQDAAFYVNRDSAVDIADKLCSLIDSSENYKEMIKKGKDILLKYPTIQDRIREEIDYVSHVFQKL
jgi:glycosyltransferase involved in cell wall biosynthesis